MSHWSFVEKALIDEKDEVGERHGFAILQYMVHMHLTMSSDNLFGVSGTRSEIRVPKCSAKLIKFEEEFCAYCKGPFKEKLSVLHF